jgi:hypothetical protein
VRVCVEEPEIEQRISFKESEEEQDGAGIV